MSKLYGLIIVVAAVLMACNSVDTEELKALIDDCNRSIESQEEIEKHLIGEWELVGIKRWGAQSVWKDITLIIDKDSIVLTDRSDGQHLKTDWSLKLNEVNNSNFYYLVTSEGSPDNRLGMDVFCQDYMHGHGRCEDCDTYVYAKIK